MRKLFLFRHLLRFRHDLVRLWHAFFDRRTPLHLKAAMLAVLAYLVSPIDLIPDFILGLGIVDDLVLVPMALSWIASRLPPGIGEPNADRKTGDIKTIDGTARRR